jgi:hypothetical protein
LAACRRVLVDLDEADIAAGNRERSLKVLELCDLSKC